METAARPGARGRLAKLEDAFKLRYAGIGFIWAWIYSCYETSAVFPDRGGIGINADASWLPSAAVVTVALFVFGVLLGRVGAGRLRPLAAAGAVCACAGTVLPAVYAPAHLHALLVLSGAVLSGAGTALLIVLWGMALARLDGDQVELAVPASSLVTFACALVFPYLPPSVGVAATATLPVASAIMLVSTLRRLPAEGAAGAGEAGGLPQRAAGDLRRTLLRTALVLFLAYFVAGCSGALAPVDTRVLDFLGMDLPVLLGSAVGIVLMGCFILFSVRTNFDSLFRWIGPLLMAFLALSPWSDLPCEFLARTFINVADTALQIAAVLFAMRLAQQGALRASLAMGLIQGMLQLGVLAGNVTGWALAASSAPGAGAGHALALAVILSLTWLFFPVERWTAEARDDQAAEGDANRDAEVASVPASGARASLDQACALLAEQGGLSSREEEILGYLARGRSQPYIREELVLSKNTVASHVKHIYQKLDVHSRQELLDRIEEAREPARSQLPA